MKICFLAHAASIHTRRWMYFFRDQGHQVSVITLTPTEPLANIDVHFLQSQRASSYKRTNWHYLLKLPHLYRKIRDIQPDIINAHFLSSYGFLGALIKPTRIPFVVSLHGSDILIFPKRSPLHRWVTRFTLKQADMITSVALHITQELENYGIDQKLLLTLQYGVDTKKFYLVSASAPRDPVCLSNRAMVSVSNLNTVLLAARELKKINPKIHIYLAGEGDLSESLHAQVKELSLENQVSFLGKIEHKEMPDLLKKAAIYISMTTSDGTSLSLLEAMACGAFPIVSDIPANQAWIQDGVNGYLVSPNSPQQLAEKINNAWQQPQLRQKAARYNWSLIQKKGSYKKNMTIIENAFNNLAAQKT